jgi:HSP20 family protein
MRSDVHPARITDSQQLERIIMADDTDKSSCSSEKPFERLRQELDTLLESAWTQGSRAFDTVRGYAGKFWTPLADVVETPDLCVVTIDLPGCDPQSVEVSLLGNMLTVKGERIAAAASDQTTSHRQERPAGPFCRSIPLPASVDLDKVVAESKHGVLTIQLSKLETAKPRQIRVEIKSAATEAPGIN